MGINKRYPIPYTQRCMYINHKYPPHVLKPSPTHCLYYSGAYLVPMHTPPGASGHQLPGAPSHTLRFRVEGLDSGVVTYLVSGLTCALCDGEEDALNSKSSVLVCLPQHGGMGSSRLSFYSPLLGPSGYRVVIQKNQNERFLAACADINLSSLLGLVAREEVLRHALRHLEQPVGVATTHGG